MTESPPRRLLHVFPTFAVGGAQVRFAALANRFGPRWRHAVVAMDGNTDCRARLAPDLDVTFPTVAVRKGDTLGSVRRFRRVLRDLRPDALVTSNWGSIEWAMANLLVGLPHIHMEDGFGPEERERQLPRRAWARRLALRRSTVVVPSHTLARIARDVWRLPRVCHIPNGVDLSRFARVEEPCPWPGEGPVIGTVAALRPEKALDRLLGAFARLGRGRLVVVGDGPDRARLEALARRPGLAGRVHFAGPMADPAPAYRQFDLFALSSDTEQMPLSVLEAMAAGLAVAATDVGDVAAMVAAENRPFLVPREEGALAGAMAALLEAPARRQAIGAANRAKAEREYDQEAMFSAYAALLDSTRRNKASWPWLVSSQPKPSA